MTELDGLRVVVAALTRPTDGPAGTAVLWLSDGAASVLVQGDAQPADLRLFSGLGPVDVHLLQVVPAGWAPMGSSSPSGRSGRSPTTSGRTPSSARGGT